MDSEQLVPIKDVCLYHEVEYSFISLLQDYGLIEISVQQNIEYIPQEQMKDLERMIRLHNDLDINTEGLNAVMHLLKTMDNMQQEIKTLQHRLRWYER